MTTTVSFSELINHPKSTVSKIDRDRALRLRRRDAEGLVLKTATRDDQDSELSSATTRMFVAMMRREGAALDLLVDVVPDAFPWVRFLPAEDVRAFVVELVNTLRAVEDLDNPAPVVQLITEWRNTAEVHADRELSRILTEDTGDDGAATEPPAV